MKPLISHKSISGDKIIENGENVKIEMKTVEILDSILLNYKRVSRFLST